MSADDATYVVTLVGWENPNPHKHFSDRRDAEKYVLELEDDPSSDYYEHADIYQMSGYMDAESAIAARKRGEGELIERRTQTSPFEVRRRF
jgi:hypothetical protein